MFGIIRPCRHRLGDELGAAWLAHLCGMCLALRSGHGQLARLVTNYDAVVISALVEAQTGTAGNRRQAGPCALRGMRRASVASGPGAQLAASVSLLLAAAKIKDHLDDGDVTGAVRVRAGRAVSERWAGSGRTSGAALHLDGGALLEVVAQQGAVERGATSILQVTEPTETATALAFRHTALVAGRPDNAEALGEAGRLFGRLAHLLDAVEDRHADQLTGAWNPITALGLSPDEVRRQCDDARLGVELALRDVELVEARLVHVLLVHELDTAVRRAFARAGQPSSGGGWGTPPESPRRRNPVVGCLGWAFVCGTGQVCCAGDYTDPCTGQQRRGACRGHNSGPGQGDSSDSNWADCGDCCDCDCGDCCGACDCGDCDCGGCDCSC
jgi:hypothetical protein